MRDIAPRLFLDLGPLRTSRDLRWLFSGHVASVVGSQVSAVAVPLQAYQMTRSSLVVGLLGLAQFVPVVVTGVLGGSIVDAYDRRRVLMASQALLAVTGVGLVVNALLPRPSLVALFILSAAIGSASALNAPARIAIVPRLVPRAELVPALALVQTVQQIARVVGPAIAGLVIAQWGFTTAYAIDAVGFAVAIVGTGRMRAMPVTPLEAGAPPRGTFRSVVEGLRFVRTEPVLRAAFLADVAAMTFALPRAAFPELGLVVLAGNAATVGLLHAAPAAGALVGILGSGWTGRVRRPGVAVVAAVVAWGGAVGLVGVAVLVLGPRALPIVLVLLAVSGAADVFSALFRNAMLQWITPDRMRGRMAGLHVASASGGPRLGDAQVGITASLVGAAWAVAAGGAICVVAVLVLSASVPAFRRWRLNRATPEAEWLP